MTRRQMALTVARICGYENDSKTFTRLRVESRVAFPLLAAEWAKGVTLRESGQPLTIAEEPR